MNRRILTLLAIVLIALTAAYSPALMQDADDSELLVYSVMDYDEGTQLYLVDSATDAHTLLYETEADHWLVYEFSPDGRIAVTTFPRDGQRISSDLLIFDTAVPDAEPRNLTAELRVANTPVSWTPLAWSNDGRTLAFSVFDERMQMELLFLWDGERPNNITPELILDTPRIYNVTWSDDDSRLALTIWHDERLTPPEIFVYDSNHPPTYNLSQNPAGEDRAPVWNSRGELVFGSEVDGEQMLLLWDGTLNDRNQPERESFTRVAPELDIRSMLTTWIKDDVLAVEATNLMDSSRQIYAWDGFSARNISQLPDTDSSMARWSDDGYWGFITSFTDPQEMHIRDANNQTVLITEALFGPEWGADGSLLFCRYNRQQFEWDLLRWDREQITEIVQGEVIVAQWQSGQRIVCSVA